VPPKVRELMARLDQAEFVDRDCKGRHRNYVHPNVTKPITLSGRLLMMHDSTSSRRWKGQSKRRRNDR
jgi:hypothetical protein